MNRTMTTLNHWVIRTADAIEHFRQIVLTKARREGNLPPKQTFKGESLLINGGGAFRCCLNSVHNLMENDRDYSPGDTITTTCSCRTTFALSTNIPGWFNVPAWTVQLKGKGKA